MRCIPHATTRSALSLVPLMLLVCGAALTAMPDISGTPRQWQAITLTFAGPAAAALDDNPNPFLDYRLCVTFTSPGGKSLVVPGFLYR